MFLVLTRMLWTVLEGSICSTCSSRYFPFFFLYRREGLTLVEVIRLFEICYKHYSTDALCPLKTARCFFLRNWLCRFWLCSPPLNCVFLVFFFFNKLPLAFIFSSFGDLSTWLQKKHSVYCTMLILHTDNRKPLFFPQICSDILIFSGGYFKGITAIFLSV